MGFGLPDSC